MKGVRGLPEQVWAAAQSRERIAQSVDLTVVEGQYLEKPDLALRRNGYYGRSDDRAFAAHRKLFDAFACAKREIVALADVEDLRSH